jgi:hypothetical protein
LDYYNIEHNEDGFHINGFPDSVKIINLDGPEAKRLADLFLHKLDLEFADFCLNTINQTPLENMTLRLALWHSAIIYYTKCFGRSTRFQLSQKKIYKNEPPAAIIIFDYFKNLRNKHLVHDDNPYSQCKPGAIINNGAKDYKIDKIICFAATVNTLNEGNFGNLKLLIKDAKKWVDEEYDVLCERFTRELERYSYDDLMRRTSMTYQPPKPKQVSCSKLDKA